MARGEFVGLLDHDDELELNALQKVWETTLLHNDIDYIYTDEDKIDACGTHYDQFLKPDWSPERLRGQNYCCHFSVLRRSLVEQIGGFRSEYEGSQDYDLILRVTEKARRIHHIPEILYHWRAVGGSTASSLDQKPYAQEAAKRAVTDHLARVGIRGRVDEIGNGYMRVLRDLNARPLLSIVIPTRGVSKTIRGLTGPLVSRFVDSITTRSTYDNYEIIVVADSDTPIDITRNLAESPRVKVIPYSKPFNFSEKCNLGVLHSQGSVVVLLNDDMEVIDRDWMETLLGLVLEPDVGIVGPMLLLEDSRIQSAGHSNTPSPHNFRTGFSSADPGEFGMLTIARECSGVTGAAMAIRRDVYLQAGGMSELFNNCFNDVDFCFKVMDLGYRIVWTPHAKLFHFESVTRDPRVSESEYQLLLSRWGHRFDNDRYCRVE
jgi:GT2 family glycosyltransferase